MNIRIPFNEPYLTGQELSHVSQVLESGHLSGNGPFTKKCQKFFEQRYGFLRTFLTASCTDALEMCAILADVQPGDEVIMPSYTFVSTANAFALRGAKIRFCDSLPDHPNLDIASVESLISAKTKVIVVMHYGGVACDMDEIMALASKHGILVVEDAAQAVDCFYKGRPLGSIGDMAAFSFHETKNIQCGQGGLAIVNNPALVERAEFVWEKGTNRSKFVRGQVDKYSWVDLGSSYLPGETVAALLWAQLENLDDILEKRRRAWDFYEENFQTESSLIERPRVPEYVKHNGHIYYFVFETALQMVSFQERAKEFGIQAHTHYVSLHRSPYFQDKHDGRSLPNADKFADCLIRLPIYSGIGESRLETVVESLRPELKKFRNKVVVDS